MIITIDGPAGSGKSTAARNLATAMGIAYLDTGATYRAATYQALEDGADMSNEQALARIAGSMSLEFVTHESGQQVLVNGRDVTADIRTPRVTQNVRHLAASPVVRQVLVDLQRKIAADLGSFVTEGRDQGSVVFPDAEYKFYLDASGEQRAKRRCDELQAAGQDAQYADVLEAILQRDAGDLGRKVAPLTKPPGAIVVDTSDLTIEEMTALLLSHVEGEK